MTENLRLYDLDPTQLFNIQIGMIVEIEDLRTRNSVQGKIIFIVSQSNHPDGILVKLENKCKGHVKKIIRTTIEAAADDLTETIELLPESFKLEYKEHFNISGEVRWYPTQQGEFSHMFQIFKAISGLANAEGGKVIIGVKDPKDGSPKITGLKKDFKAISEIMSSKKGIQFQKYSDDQDGMELKITDEFAHFFKNQPLVKNLVSAAGGIEFHGKTPEEMVCIINIARSTEAVVMFDKSAPENKRGPHLFVRVNNQTLPYDPLSFLQYWTRHILGMKGAWF